VCGVKVTELWRGKVLQVIKNLNFPKKFIELYEGTTLTPTKVTLTLKKGNVVNTVLVLSQATLAENHSLIEATVEVHQGESAEGLTIKTDTFFVRGASALRQYVKIWLACAKSNGNKGLKLSLRLGECNMCDVPIPPMDTHELGPGPLEVHTHT